MQQYTEIKTIRLTKIQADSLKMIESKGVNISNFIRSAIRSKIKQDWAKIKQPKPIKKTPF